jgi:hypothetical protein
MITSYSASLLSHIMISEQKQEINGFQDLLNDRSYRLGVLHHSADLSYFKVR